MTKTITPVSFFFGANSRKEYTSLFSSAYDKKADGMHYILKGGPGTGKSTLMKKLAIELEKKGYFVERGYCSADPNSLDMVIAPEINFSILDGTSPHTFDATYPGVTESVINLGVAWDKKYLNEYKTAIINLSDENKRLHKKASEYITLVSKLQLEAMKYCDRITDREKVKNYMERLCCREIPTRKNTERGTLNKRFLSAVSPDGVDVKYETVVALSEKIITVEDEFSAVSPFIAEYISAYALENGYDVYQCYCPLFPNMKIEHIIIPQLKTAIFTQNSYHYSIDDGERLVHATRFYDKDTFNANKEKLALQKRAKRELIDEAVKKLSIAKDIHDRLEEYYIKATDFDVINEMGEKILKSI